MTRLAVWYMQRVTCTVRYKNWHFSLHNMTFCDILMENHALFLPSYGDFWHKNCIRRLVKGRCICENVEMPSFIDKWRDLKICVYIGLVLENVIIIKGGNECVCYESFTLKLTLFCECICKKASKIYVPIINISLISINKNPKYKDGK